MTENRKGMMKVFKQGDKVSVLDDSFSGVVKAVKGSRVIIETTEGFELEFSGDELIKLDNTGEFKSFITSQRMFSAIQEKETPKRKNTPVREKRSKKDGFVLEVDLHIEKLVKNKNGMSNYDILTLQTETAKGQLEFAIRNRMPKVVLIHGVGEGILKAELDFLLGRYEGITFRDADYQKYGLGATEIHIKQNPNR